MSRELGYMKTTSNGGKIMKIIVLNGSPKSNNSATLQSMNFLQLKFPNVEFEQIHLIAAVRKGDDKIKEVAKSVAGADGIVWSFPVYHELVPAHMKSFIEKVFELGLKSAFYDKYATSFTTSIHFYDHTAHEYIEGICNDLNSNYISGLSHDMNDLTIKEKRNELCFFFENFMESIEVQEPCIKKFKPVTSYDYIYKPGSTINEIETSKRTVVVTDATEGSNIDRMVNKYASTINGPIEIINLNKVNMGSYCIGCCNCAPENICVFHDKDDYRKTLDFILDNSDMVIFAGELKDRYFSSRDAIPIPIIFSLTSGLIKASILSPTHSNKCVSFSISGNIILL